jgi:hypothetical protein
MLQKEPNFLASLFQQKIMLVILALRYIPWAAGMKTAGPSECAGNVGGATPRMETECWVG